MDAHSDTGAPVKVGLALRQLLSSHVHEFVLVPALLLLILVGATTNSAFLTSANIGNVLNSSAPLALLVLAEALILICGFFDLSLESIVVIVPGLGLLLMLSEEQGGFGVGLPPGLTLVLMVALGLAIGLINALLIIKLGLNAFIVTLSMLILLRGVHEGLTNSGTLYGAPEQITFLSDVSLLGFSLAVWLVAVAFVVAAVILKYHWVGRAIYAIGGNAEAAELCGVSVSKIRYAIFGLAGVLATVAGMMLTGYIGAVPPNMGDGMIFTVFAAAVVGGVSLQGGRGTMFGALLGVLLLALVQNLLTLAQVPTYWIQAVYGAIILLALIISRITGRERQS